MTDFSGPHAVHDPFFGAATLSPDHRRLQSMIIAIGFSCSLLFVIIGLWHDLQMYADGSIFSYSIAVQDAWAFHWHNISGRLFVYLYSYVPAETYVQLTGDARGGVVVYGLLFFAAPLLGIVGACVLDRSKNRIIFVYACLSTACLCPLVFGFPTEMWVAHALFWPTLAAAHYAPDDTAGRVTTFALMLALVLTHEGAIIFVLVIVSTSMLRGLKDPVFLKAMGTFLIVMAIWTVVKVRLPPDAYVATVLANNALNFIDPSCLAEGVFQQLVTTLAGYGAVLLVLRRLGLPKAPVAAAGAAAVVLAAHWLWFDQSLHSDGRYYLRTALLLATPVLGALAATYALCADGRLGRFTPLLSRLMAALERTTTAEAIGGGILLVMLVHAVETAKFAAAWTDYKSAVRALAMGTRSDPSLGSPSFVSAHRISDRLERLSWSSTTDFLSILVAPHFAPLRLVVDPRPSYFWLSCETAAANLNANRAAIPVESRRLVWSHACQNH